MKKTTPVAAYFSAEYAIADDLPMYAGGLGVLAADFVLEAGSQDLPVYAVGLVYYEAFSGDDPDQRPITERLMANGFELAVGGNGERLVVKVLVENRTIQLSAWVKAWGRTKLILLDTRLDGNDEKDWAISAHLYPKDPMMQLAQEICLGFGGVAMLAAMGVKADVYHLNEGHTALAGLALALEYLAEHRELGLDQALAAVRPLLVGTKHTILPGAGLLLDWRQVERQLKPALQSYGATIRDLKAVAGREEGDYSDTKLLINLVSRANGVSKFHAKTEFDQHPTTRLLAITNGVSRERWIAPAWDGQPLDYDDAKFWAVHCENRRLLLDHVFEQTGTRLDPERLTVVWARRMTPYKRPDLLISDIGRLTELTSHQTRPVQLVIAGQANPSDLAGLEIMHRLAVATAQPGLAGHVAYLPHYKPVSAKFLVRGADLWLNTPIRGYEACGTSGMKASLNGVLQFSTSDGWIDEINIKRIGWILPEKDPAKALYDTLEQRICPLFYKTTNGVPRGWIVKMRANMRLAQRQFSTTRMLADYYRMLYKPTRQTKG